MSAIYKNGKYYGVGGGGGGADTEIIADDFDPTESYDVGAYVVYEGDLYKCTTAHTGAWDAADFDATNVMNEMPTPMPSTDMSEVVTPLPGVMSRRRIYSPDEQVIGEWREYVDGVLKKKPVYEKCITGLGNTYQQWTTANFTNADRIISSYMVSRKKGAQAPSSAPCYVQIANDSGDLKIYNPIATTDSSTVYILQYTKTTDEWEVI